MRCEMMKTFEFGIDIIDRIISELDDADEFVRIAIFQLHNQDIFAVLNDKLQAGVAVEIFTLPYDSINENIRSEVTKQFHGPRLFKVSGEDRVERN